MNCKRCGTEINNNDLYCPNCGVQIQFNNESKTKSVQADNDSVKGSNDPTLMKATTKNKEDSIKSFTDTIKECKNVLKDNQNKCSDWLYFPNLFPLYRPYIIIAFKAIQYLFVFIYTIISISFIIEQINANEGFKILVYITRYIFNVFPYSLPIYIFEVLYDLASTRKTDLNNSNNKTALFIMKLSYLILDALAIATISSSTGLLELKILSAIANNSIIEYILAYDKTLLLLIGAGVLEWVIDTIILTNNKNV